MKTFGWVVSITLALVVAGLCFVYLSPDYNMYLVRSGSMKPEINVGDMIITGPVGGSLNGQVNPGVVVTYERGEELVTHRVLSVSGDRLVTKGDAVEDTDASPVTLSSVSGVYLFKIPQAGYLSDFMQTKVGWLSMIIIPAMLLVTFMIRGIVKEALSST